LKHMMAKRTCKYYDAFYNYLLDIMNYNVHYENIYNALKASSKVPLTSIAL